MDTDGKKEKDEEVKTQEIIMEHVFFFKKDVFLSLSLTWFLFSG